MCSAQVCSSPPGDATLLPIHCMCALCWNCGWPLIWRLEDRGAGLCPSTSTTVGTGSGAGTSTDGHLTFAQHRSAFIKRSDKVRTFRSGGVTAAYCLLPAHLTRKKLKLITSMEPLWFIKKQQSVLVRLSNAQTVLNTLSVSFIVKKPKQEASAVDWL